MPRTIDAKKTAKALRKLRKLRDAATPCEPQDVAEVAAAEPRLSQWETEFLDSVETRLETHGSAFADPGKGALSEPLSALQALKLKEIDRKARGRSTGMRRKAWPRRRPANPSASDPAADEPHDAPPAHRTTDGRPRLRLIVGGPSETPGDDA